MDVCEHLSSHSALRNCHSALRYAAEEGHIECLRILLSKGTSVNVLDEFGSTALIKAARHGHAECVKALISAGANVNIRDRCNKTVIELNSEIGWRMAESQGISHKDDIETGNTALMYASLRGHDKCVELLLKAGADVNLSNKSGCTALIHATGNGNHLCTSMLLIAGADVNRVAFDHKYPVLIVATQGATSTNMAG